jgi:hypothetical protein
VVQSTCATPSSTSTPRVEVGPRPAPPARPLTARPLSHDLDWDSIPTAPHGPVSMTRQQVRAQLAAVEAEGSHERTGAYESVVLGYGIPAHLTAFGGAA